MIITNTDKQWIDEIYQRMVRKMSAECKRVGSMIPYTPRNGRYRDLDAPDGLYWWTNGFWPGMLWQMYKATGEEEYRNTAVQVEMRMDETLHGFEGLYHDVGFMFLLSAVADYRKTKNPDSRRRGLHAATLLAGRYNPAGKFIRAWNEAGWNNAEDVSGWMIIDCMMNIPLLYWASDETGDPRFAYIAKEHAKTVQRYTVRPDGSCNHVIIFDAETGEYLDNPAGQGYASGSSWSRGQSWAIFGFSLSYRHTGDSSFLDTAKQCAHYCIANLAVNDWLPLVDFRAPQEPVKYDSTAGMIIACGLLELAEHVEDLEKPLYIHAALKILKACDETFNNWDPDYDSIVDGGTFFYHDPSGSDTSVPIIYGDYFFIEAILRLKKKSLFVW